jgi:hypothetical protein
MADVAANYSLATPGGTIDFNECVINDRANCYFLTEITGIDAAAIRNPMDNAPITDGGLVHNFYEGPMHPVFSGALLVQSTQVGNTIVAIRNAMKQSLLTALRSILRADGTLTWTELGVGARSLTVRYDQPLEVVGSDSPIQTFTFGLASEQSTPS